MTFKTENDTVISCRTFKEKFVDTSKYIKLIKGVKIQLPILLNEILDKAIVFAKREQGVEELVDVYIEDKHITIKSQSESSWFKERAKVIYEGEPISFSIAPNLLKDIISHTNECVLAGRLLQFQGADWIYVTSLMILK